MSHIEKIDGDISLIVSEPPAKWDFQGVRMRAQAAVDNAASALQRGRAKELLNEIARYEQLKAGYAQIDTIREQTDQQNRMVEVASAAATVPPQPAANTAASPAASTAAPQAASSVDLSQFDGVGQLRPVVSTRAGAPQFALTGQSGDVLMFLTPSPGVNLDRYVGQYVGLTGKRGYMPKLKQAHLTVAQAQPLSASILVARQQ
jgi:hypothetical protein